MVQNGSKMVFERLRLSDTYTDGRLFVLEKKGYTSSRQQLKFILKSLYRLNEINNLIAHRYKTAVTSIFLFKLRASSKGFVSCKHDCQVRSTILLLEMKGLFC